MSRYTPRLLPDGRFVVLGLDGVTWESEPTTALEAGRIARALNDGTEPSEIEPERLLTILNKLAGPDDVRLGNVPVRENPARRWQRNGGVFDQALH